MQVTRTTVKRMAKEMTYEKIAKTLARDGFVTIRGFKIDSRTINNFLAGRTTLVKRTKKN